MLTYSVSIAGIDGFDEFSEIIVLILAVLTYVSNNAVCVENVFNQSFSIYG